MLETLVPRREGKSEDTFVPGPLFYLYYLNHRSIPINHIKIHMFSIVYPVNNMDAILVITGLGT